MSNESTTVRTPADNNPENPAPATAAEPKPENPAADAPKTEPAAPAPDAAAKQAAMKEAEDAASSGEDTPWYADWRTYAWAAGGLAAVGVGIAIGMAMSSNE